VAKSVARYTSVKPENPRSISHTFCQALLVRYHCRRLVVLCPESSLPQRCISPVEVCDRHCFPVPQTVFSFVALGLCDAIRIFSKITVPPSNQLFLLSAFFFCFLSLSPPLPTLLASDWAAARTLARGRTAKWQGAEGARRKGRVNDRSRDYSLGYTLNLPLTMSPTHLG